MIPEQFTIDFAGTTYPCFYVATKAKAEAVIKQLLTKSTVLAADCETAALPQWRHIPDAALSPHLAEPRLLQMFTGTGAVVIDLYKTGKIDLKTLFETRPSVFHNMSFDFKMIRHHYNVVDPDMHCTAIMARCVFHAIYPTDKSASLKDVAKALFGDVMNKQAGRSDWSVAELTFEQIEYAAKDAVVQMRVYEKLNEFIDKLGLRKVYELYRKAQIPLCEMELNGISFDKDYHIKNIVRWRDQLLDASEEVRKVTGLQGITDAKIGKWLEENLPENTKLIWPRSEKTNRLQTDANAFVQFSELEIVTPLRQYQKLKKLTTSFGMNLMNMLNPATGKLHPNYRVAGARTGRLSCSAPNIQQSERSAEFRSTFTASPGYIMIVSDYSQIEVRIAAELSQDEKMLQIFENGLDLYQSTAAELMSKPFNEVTKAERQQAKAICLGLQFMLGAKKLPMYAKKGYGVQVTIEESMQLVEAYRNLYPDLRRWQLEQVNKCAARNFVASSPLGKSRKMTEDTYYAASVNMPVQSSAAEVMLFALVNIREAIKGSSARLLATVHDEIMLECLPAEENRIKQLVKESMIKAYKDYFPKARTLRGLVDPSSGRNWAESKE